MILIPEDQFRELQKNHDTSSTEKTEGTIHLNKETEGQFVEIGEASDTRDIESIINNIPKSLQNGARRLLTHLLRSADVNWNKRGEFIFQGNLIPHSNMTDLVKDALYS